MRRLAQPTFMHWANAGTRLVRFEKLVKCRINVVDQSIISTAVWQRVLHDAWAWQTVALANRSNATSATNRILSVNWRHITDLVSAKGENKGSVLLWCSCFDRSILMFLMREGLQSRISIPIETLSDEAVNRYQSTDFCFSLCRN